MPSVTALLNVPSFHFVVVARIEQRDGPAFIEPSFELSRRNLRRGSLAWLDARHAERDDLLLDSDEHSVETAARR